MTLGLSISVRNAELNAIETAIGASAILMIRSGGSPAMAAADSGTVLCQIQLPGDWLQAASAGSTMKAGTWSGSYADNTGIAGHFRIYANDGTTPHIQGSVTSASDAGNMTLDNVSINVGQTVTINTFNLTAGNA